MKPVEAVSLNLIMHNFLRSPHGDVVFVKTVPLVANTTFSSFSLSSLCVAAVMFGLFKLLILRLERPHEPKHSTRANAVAKYKCRSVQIYNGKKSAKFVLCYLYRNVYLCIVLTETYQSSHATIRTRLSMRMNFCMWVDNPDAGGGVRWVGRQTVDTSACSRAPHIHTPG